jgi:kynureninase
VKTELLSDAKKRDEEDALSSFREKFLISDPEEIYLDGNSLGRMPKDAYELVNTVTEKQWGHNLIRSWNDGWYDKSIALGKKLAGLIGADQDEVVFCDNTSLNLYKLVYGALAYKTDRTKIISDVFNFPSDIYLLQGIKKAFNNRHEVVLIGNKKEIEPDLDELYAKIDTNTALVTLSHVVFKSAYMYDMREITKYAHSKGALVLWDLSHACGAVPIDLNDCNADMAVGCSYKYLNGGPGAPAFLYVKKELQGLIDSPVWGWFGDNKPFQFSLDYEPAQSIRKYMSGTPPIISLSAIEPGLDMILDAGIENIRNKSINQTEYLIQLTKELLFPLGFTLGSPINPDRRGSHVSICHPEAYRISSALIEPKNHKLKVIPDFREPDIIRMGITPLYTTFQEIFLSINRIREIIQSGEYKAYPLERNAVT